MWFEEADEIISEVEESMEETEESDEILEEEKEELEREVEETKESTSKLKETVDSLKELGDNPVVAFGKFIVKIAAIGAIFYGVTVGLKKLTAVIEGGGDAPAKKQKASKIKSISQFITSASELSKEVSKWLAAHKNDMVKLEGIDVPVDAIFVKYTGHLEDVSAYKWQY